MPNRIVIDQSVNTVTTDTTSTQNQVVLSADNPDTVQVIESIGGIVTISTPGPQGAQGIQGPSGSGGGSQGDFATTGSNSFFGDQTITGSIIVSGSFNLEGNLVLESSLLGPKVSFVKTPYSSSQIDVITPGVTELARGNNQGLYNAALEGSYTNSSPSGTLWNSIYTDSNNYGWGNLQSLSYRNYSTWRSAINNNAGYYIIDLPMVMWDTNTNKYYLIKFYQWTPGANGGGFSYDRYEVLLPQSSSFIKPDYSSSIQDTVSPSLIIARGSNRGLYNAVLESQYDNSNYTSPLGTRWNSSYTDDVNYGWSDLSNIKNRYYSTWAEAVDYNTPEAVSSSLELIMHDIAQDQYYKIKFKEWTQGGNGGGFKYERTLIKQDTSLVFPDGTEQVTAFSDSLLSVKSTGGTQGTLYSNSPKAGPGFSNYRCIILGTNAGENASNAQTSNFIGVAAGQYATSAQYSNFIGFSAGASASRANESVFLGIYAGQYASDAYSSNFIGRLSGYVATFASNANFIGTTAGQFATNAEYSNFMGYGAGFLATTASYSNFIGYSAGDRAYSSSNSNFIGNLAGKDASNSKNSNFIGYWAGRSANSEYSNFIGDFSGYGSVNSYYSNFIGASSGRFTNTVPYSTIIGYYAGENANNCYFSNFIGSHAGYNTTGISNSNFIGYNSGNNTTQISYSNFVGDYAGAFTTSTGFSNFIGYQAGKNASYSSYSTFIGYNAGNGLVRNVSTNLPANNLIIGNNITIPNNIRNYVNIGGLIFGSGSYSDIGSNPFSGSANGKVGINQPNPQQALDVSGSITFSDVLVLPYKNPLPSGKPTGSLALSGSGATFVGMYVYNGTSWIKVSV